MLIGGFYGKLTQHYHSEAHSQRGRANVALVFSVKKTPKIKSTEGSFYANRFECQYAVFRSEALQ
ncbi:hypothetical protein LSP04_16290 [Levilactobacillus spicheri]|uniref:Uncharacterized protein n=1 Tax=Levilactobacillus spicheri TaxID=216463 RepID=A0ABQ0WU73_9LACO|nr:hypothetical protein LSP04_16290 [Levilactobacillus spicheri]